MRLHAEPAGPGRLVGHTNPHEKPPRLREMIRTLEEGCHAH